MNLPIAPFGEIQVSEKDILTYASFHYNINSELVTTSNANGGSITQADSTALLASGTNPAGQAGIQSRLPARYIAGQGLLIVFSALFAQGKPNSTQEVGYGSASDGYFFGYDGEQFGVLRRSSVGGTPTEYHVTKEQWAHPDFQFSPQNFNVYGISFQWLGAGEIVWWVESPHQGILTPVYKERYANAYQVPSILNPSLPLYADVRNGGNTSGLTLKIGNMAAYVFGKREQIGVRQAYRAAQAYTAGAERVVFAIENMTDVFAGTGNNRSVLNPTHMTYSTEGAKPVVFRVKRCTISGGTNAVINANTSIAKSYTGTPTVTNEKLLFSIEASKADQDTFPFPDDVLLAPGEAMVVTAESATNSDIAASISWKELL